MDGHEALTIGHRELGMAIDQALDHIQLGRFILLAETLGVQRLVAFEVLCAQLCAVRQQCVQRSHVFAEVERRGAVQVLYIRTEWFHVLDVVHLQELFDQRVVAEHTALVQKGSSIYEPELNCCVY